MTDNEAAAEHADLHFAYEAIWDGLHLCGCGNPELIFAEALNVLRACPLYEHRWQPSPGLGPIGADLLLDVMNDAELLEHGGSKHASWITDKGARLLRIADGRDFDDLDAGYSGCSDCPDWGKPEADGGTP